MRRLAGGGVEWLRRLWPPSGAASAASGGTELLAPVESTLGALELLVCDGVVHRPGDVSSATRASRVERAGPAPRNAFGGPVHEEVGAGAEGAVAVATGMALSGLRATAFLGGGDLASAHRALHAAADRLAPLVLHAAGGDAGHAPYHGVADFGLFQVLPCSGQEALDLSLVAHWLAERALVPGIVATDGLTLEPMRLPDEEMVRAYLGAPDEPIASPTEAQRVLFGGERPRLIAWFDPDRPVATGGIRGAAEEARAALGGRLFFRDPVAALARRGMEELTRLTGRPLSFLHRHRFEDADLVLVAQGAVARTARAVADHLRRRRGWKVGVLGVTWLRPFPALDLAEALDGRRAVAVVEAVGGSLADDPPLLRELRSALGAGEGWVSATCSGRGPEPARLVGLCELLRGHDRPRRIDLERAAVPETTGFPRRDALLQSLANDYPELRQSALPEVEPPGLDPEGGRSVGLVGREAELPNDAFRLLAEAVSAEAGSFARGTASRPEPGTWEARVRAAATDFSDPGPRAPVSLLLVTAADPRELGQPLAAVEPGGTVLVARGDPPERIWATIPPAWRREVEERGLRLLAVGEEFDAGIEAVRACLRGEERALLEDGRLRAVEWRELSSPDPTDRDLPRLVSRIERVRESHDSLPRFWGEVVQPRQGGATDAVPDPLAASGAVPAGGSALELESAASVIPVLDPEACNGCGRCWTACPDSAIGVTALGGEALFTAASHLAGTEGKAADALRRAHKHLAGRLAGQLASSGAAVLTAEASREAWEWLAGRLELSEADRPAHEAAFEATLQAVTRLQPAVTRPFFEEPEAQQKGSGEFLILAVNPRACLGCKLCVAACPEDALRSVDRDGELVAELGERWAAWEKLPDTPGASLARAAEDPELGLLAAALLSRHTAQAQLGGAAGEPGSGERLGARLTTALVEYHAQRRMVELLEAIDARREALERKLREELGEGLSGLDPETLAEALRGVTRARAPLSALGEKLDELGAPATFDRPAALRIARLAGELALCRRRLAEGEDGLGRARFGVVVARGTVAEWAARFPLHPFYAPLTLAPTAESAELARGIARGLVAEHLELRRALRRAALEADSPPDRSARVEEIEALAWTDLDDGERASCPPLLLLGDETALLERGFDALTRLLASDLPVKVVLLDGRGRLDAGPEPALVAMAHRRAFVLAGSLAHPEHLARGVADALAWPGPALIHLYAPSPLRHGFAPDATLDRALSAVEGRAHILFRYDPAAEGLFGLRASLEGNPEPEQPWGGATFVDWAAGEARFAHHFEPREAAGGTPLADWLALPAEQRGDRAPVVEVGDRHLAVGERVARAAEERLAVWNTLRELTGAAGPFTERIRGALAKEIEADHQGQLDALKAEYESQIAELRAGSDREAVARLTERFMALAGYGSKGQPRGTRS